MEQNKFIAISAILIALSIAMGAFGAHILNPGLEDKYIRTLGTANQYFIINSIGLLVVSLLGIEQRSIRTVYILILLGIICFSGSLFAIVVYKYMHLPIPFIVGPLTPLGGSLLIAGWSYLALISFKKKA